MPRRRASQQPTRVPNDLPMGERAKLTQAQNTIPLPNNQPSATAPAPPAPGGQQAQGALPIDQSALPSGVFDPTQRPTEPITAGARMGPGPNQLNGLPQDPAQDLRAILIRYPSVQGLRIIERMDRSRHASSGSVPQDWIYGQVPQ